MNLTGKRVWITGASSGLGEAMAYKAAELGAYLILSARNESKLEALAASLPSRQRAMVLPLDLTKPASFAEAVRAAGRIDYLINNGGISQRGKAADTPMPVVRKVMETNFFGHVELTQLVLPNMLAQGNGHIAVTSSVVGYFGTPMRSSYAASKHALHGYFDSLRYEIADQNILVTIICPGYIKTDISKNAVTADGTPQGTMDDNQAGGMLPDVFADKAWGGLLSGKQELYIGGTQEVAGVYLKRYAPGILSRIVSKRKWDGNADT